MIYTIRIRFEIIWPKSQFALNSLRTWNSLFTQAYLSPITMLVNWCSRLVWPPYSVDAGSTRIWFSMHYKSDCHHAATNCLSRLLPLATTTACDADNFDKSLAAISDTFFPTWPLFCSNSTVTSALMRSLIQVLSLHVRKILLSNMTALQKGLHGWWSLPPEHLRRHVLCAKHDGAATKHMRFSRTNYCIQVRFYWPKTQ